MTLVDRLRELLPQKRSVEFYAMKLGISEDEVIKLKKQIKKAINEEMVDEYIESVDNYYSGFSKIESKNEHIEKGTTEIKFHHTAEVLGEEEIWQETKMDKTKWKFVQVYHKKFGKGFLYTANFRAKGINDITGNDILKTLEDYKTPYIPLNKSDILINSSFGKPTCAFIDITDFHLDKRDIYETPIEQKVEEYHKLLDGLLYKAYQSNNLEEIAFVVGSDMLHTDNFFNQTTKFTQQETTVRWDEAFNLAFDIYVQSINKLKQFCKKLNVILIAGNHSRTKEYYLAFALKKYFESEKSIVFDISTSPRKVFTYGNTFIGLHHGNTKLEALPIVFAKEFTELWGKAKYHEILVGDKHHYMEKDYSGVRIKMLPACTNADTWHNDNNFTTSEQSAIVSIYDKEKGRCMQIEEKL
mgnify:FL=1